MCVQSRDTFSGSSYAGGAQRPCGNRCAFLAGGLAALRSCRLGSSPAAPGPGARLADEGLEGLDEELAGLAENLAGPAEGLAGLDEDLEHLAEKLGPRRGPRGPGR